MSNTRILQTGMLEHTAVNKAGQPEYEIEGGRPSFLVLATTLANKIKIK